MSKQKHFSWRFWIQLIPLIPLIFWVWYINTPTNGLNSNAMCRYLEQLGRYSGMIAFLSALPIGVVGLWHLNEADRLYKATKVLAIVNLWIAGLAVASLLLYIIMLFT